jgi:hypothetical protein
MKRNNYYLFVDDKSSMLINLDKVCSILRQTHWIKVIFEKEELMESSVLFNYSDEKEAERVFYNICKDFTRD